MYTGGDECRICGILGEFSPKVIALFFALMRKGHVMVPFTRDMGDISPLLEVADVECMFTFDEHDAWAFERYEMRERKPLLARQIAANRPGLVVFSSGSTGKPKGILQDCEKVMGKFKVVRKS